MLHTLQINEKNKTYLRLIYVFNMSYTTGFGSGTGTAYASRAHEFIRVAQSVVFCVVIW